MVQAGAPEKRTFPFRSEVVFNTVRCRAHSERLTSQGIEPRPDTHRINPDVSYIYMVIFNSGVRGGSPTASELSQLYLFISSLDIVT